jgi:outer membrane immunogenic protein
MAARSKITLSLAAMAAGLAALPAAAADMSLRGSMPAYEATGANWGGFYGGIHGGIGSLNLDAQSMGRREAERLLNGLVYLNPPGGTPAPDLIAIDPIRSSPRIFGLFFGYQAQFEDAVVGVEFDYNRVAGGGGGSRTWAQPFSVLIPNGTTYTDAFTQSVTTRASITDYVTARLRAGWAYGRIMPYLTGGLALVRGNTSVTYTAGYTRIDTDPADGVDWTQPYTEITPPAPANSRTANGVIGIGGVLGTGVEALITDNIFVRGEYQYIRVPSLGGVPVTLHTIRAGVGVKY